MTTPKGLAAATGAALVLSAAVIVVWLRGAEFQAMLLARWVLPAGLAAAEVVAAIGTSASLHALVRRLVASPRPLKAADHLILGVPLFGTVAYLVALVTTARLPMACLLGAAALAGVVHLLRRPVPAPRAPSFAAGAAGWIAAGLLAVAFAIAFLWATLPPATIDEVAYHLAVPKTWVLDGRALQLPLLSHSYFPFGVESAHLPALSLLGDAGALTAHLVHLAVAVAVVALLVGWVRARSSTESALVAAVTVASAPALVTTAGLAWLEWPLLGSSLLVVFNLEEDGDPAAVALAVAAGLLTKYTAATFVLATFAAGVFFARKDRPRLRRLATAFALGGALGSVFYLRNLAQTGNPIAPFLSRLAPSLSHFNAATSAGELLQRYVYDSNLMDEAIGASPFIALFFLAAGWGAAGGFLRAVSLALALAALQLFLLGPSARVLIPFLAPLAVLGVVSIERAALPRPALPRALLLSAAAIQLFAAAFFLNTYAPFSILQKGPGTAPVLSEKAFLSQRVENFFPAIDLVNQRLPPGSRVLVVGLQRLYWFARSARGGGNFDGPRVAAYLDAGSPEDLRTRLIRDGITHVAVFKTMLLVDDGRPLQGFHAETRTVLPARTLNLLRDAMNLDAVSVGSDRAVELYQLR